MKHTLFLSSLVLALLVAGCKGTPKSASSTEAEGEPMATAESYNPLPIRLGDPFILHASDGCYYMYGTSLGDGFEAFVSTDLKAWEPCGQVYRGGTDGQWNVDCFWAPEVYERDGRYYMFYSSNAKDNPTNEGENFRIGVAVSDSPKGPFTDYLDRPVFNPPYPIIDADVFFDDATGRCYLYFSRCCYKHAVESELAQKVRAEGGFSEIEESWVYGVELKPDFSGVIGEPVLLLAPPMKLDDTQAEWESRSVTSGEVNRRWTEGSFTFRVGDTYYMMYSANSYQGAHYAVGYATSDNPLGPFQKSADNPVLQENVSRGGTVMGTGHNMMFRDGKGRMLTVYHGRLSSNPDERVAFIDPMEITADGHLVIHGPTVKAE